jgi:hypothetical protein
MAIVYFAVEVAYDPQGYPSAFGVVYGLVALTVAGLLSLWVPRPRDQHRLPTAITLLLGLLLIAPLLIEPVLREVTGNGQPLELQMVNGLRALGVGLLALTAWPLCLRLAGVVSLFLMLFVAAMGDQKPIPWFLASYAVVGSVWLMIAYAARFQTTPSSACLAAQLTLKTRLRLPIRELATLIILVGTALSLIALGPKRVLLTLGEWVPTSGGTGRTDLFARFGIGDGPEEMAGDNAQAAGMVETDKMIEDNKNALVDLVNDMYGPPHKPPQQQEKMVAGGKAEVISFHGRLPENRRPSRDFDTSRQGPKQKPNKLQSSAARSLFEVQGKTPLHIRLIAYEKYDAQASRWYEGRKPSVRLLEAIGGDWMRVSHIRPHASWYQLPERHRFKVADLKANLVPTPPLLTALRIHKVDRPDYYEWDYEGVLVLAGRSTTPPGVVVTTECQTVDYVRLRRQDLIHVKNGDTCSPIFVEVPEPIQSTITSLAEQWAGNYPLGWSQIEAILHRLRTEYTVDPLASAPPDHPVPVLWFLTESFRGPDYLFASATALLLRSLGYPCRVCLGYYAHPDAYDPQTDHTPVRACDLHFWPEILLRDGQWLVIEPTPGYQVLGPRRPWSQRLLQMLQDVTTWICSHPFLVSGGIIVAGLIFWKRRQLWDVALVSWWRCFPGRSWQIAVCRCLQLLERRCRWSGYGRAPQQTLSRWSVQLPGEAAAKEKLQLLINLGEQAMYAPQLPPPLPPPAIYALCQHTLQTWSLHHLQRQRVTKD